MHNVKMLIEMILLFDYFQYKTELQFVHYLLFVVLVNLNERNDKTD